jgi:hypothetical protein
MFPITAKEGSMALGGFNPIGLIPGRKKPQRRCERCGLYRDQGQVDCPHCSNLDDHELAEFKRLINERAEANRNLGWSFLVVALAIGLLLVLAL